MAHQSSITKSKSLENFKIPNEVNLKSEKIEKNFEIVDVKTTAEASNLISSSAFQAKLKTLPRVFAIILRIHESLNIQNIEKPRKFEFQGKRRLLISFESTIEENKKIIFWRCQQNKNFSILKLIYSYTTEVTSFARDFLIECLEKPDFYACEFYLYFSR